METMISKGKLKTATLAVVGAIVGIASGLFIGVALVGGLLFICELCAENVNGARILGSFLIAISGAILNGVCLAIQEHLAVWWSCNDSNSAVETEEKEKDNE